MDQEKSEIVELYTAYIQGLKRLSAKERDEIVHLFKEYKNKKEIQNGTPTR